MKEALPASATGKPIEIWFQDEARVGQKGTLEYTWAPVGSRPRAVRDNRHDSVYLFGALCAYRAVGAAVIMPAANSEAMCVHLKEIKRIGAFVLYLLHYQLLPEKRLATLMADLFGVPLATATIARISRGCAERVQNFAMAVCDQVAAAPVKHLDETGFRIGGKTQWLHIACTTLLTFYRVSAKRGSLLANVAGIVVHDHWHPYYTLKNVLHALCNAHHLRELKALVEIEKEDWARRMQRLLRRACHAVNLASARDVRLKPELIALPSLPTEWPSMRRNQPWQRPGRGAGRHDAWGTTCCCGSVHESRTCSAF